MGNRSEALATKTMSKLGAELEREYREERRQAAEKLYNTFAHAIADQQPSLETVLYVMEMLRYGLLEQRYAETFGPGAPVMASSTVKVKASAVALGAV